MFYCFYTGDQKQVLHMLGKHFNTGLYLFFILKQSQELERWFSCQEHLLLLQRTWVQFTALTWWFTTISNSSYRGSSALFWAPWVPTTHVVHIHTCKQNTYTQNKINKQTSKQNQKHSLTKLFRLALNLWSSRLSLLNTWGYNHEPLSLVPDLVFLCFCPVTENVLIDVGPGTVELTVQGRGLLNSPLNP